MNDFSTRARERLPDRRASEVFTARVSRFPDGRIGEIFVDNHKAGSAIGTLVRDMAIVFSFAVQHGADPEDIRRALCRESQGRPLGPLATVLDLLAEGEATRSSAAGRTHLGSSSGQPTYIVRLRPAPHVDPIRALRAGLKHLLRVHGLRCLSAREGSR